MSDIESGAIPAASSPAPSSTGSGSSSNQGARGTGGRAASAAPSVSQSGGSDYGDVELVAQTNRGMAAQAGDDQDQDTGEDWDGPDAEGDGTESEPEDELTQLRRERDEYERRNKGYAARLQQEVEARRRYEAQLQQAQFHAFTQQLTQDEVQFQRDWHQFEARREYMTQDQEQAEYRQLQGRAQVLHRDRQLRIREAQLAAREAAQAPQKRANDLKRLQEGYAYHYKIDVPDRVLQHARTWDEAIKSSHAYAEGVLASRDHAREQVNGSSGGKREGRSASAPPVRGNRSPDRFGNKVGSEVLADYFNAQRKVLQRQP